MESDDKFFLDMTAMYAMQALISKAPNSIEQQLHREVIAKRAYRMAEEMLKESKRVQSS